MCLISLTSFHSTREVVKRNTGVMIIETLALSSSSTRFNMHLGILVNEKRRIRRTGAIVWEHQNNDAVVGRSHLMLLKKPAPSFFARQRNERIDPETGRGVVPIHRRHHLIRQPCDSFERKTRRADSDWPSCLTVICTVSAQTFYNDLLYICSQRTIVHRHSNGL